MKKQKIRLPEIKLVGISVRTNNKTEIDPMAGKIFGCIQRYFHQELAKKITHRKKPGTTLCVYTDYESDHSGDYTYIIGEEVDSFESCPSDFVTHVIPAQDYIKFTNGPAPMPEVVREPWFKIWQMSDEDLGGKRLYKADFEVYDERASDHQNIVLDILIGIDPKI
jgi:predicted transcriptional regulator YdeE